MLNYQGRVSVNGTNFTGNGNFKFALVSSGRNDNRQATGIAQRAGKFIWGVQITDGGAGYSSAPAVRIVGGGGSGAQAIATVSNGAITWIEVFNPGNNYTGTPTVEIDPPQENLTHTTFWSHDGTSANGFAPASSVNVAAEKGIFSTLIGGSGMQPVPENVFTNESVYLRVWFSPGGTNSFEQLLPDQRIATVGYAMKSKNAGTADLAQNAVTASNAQNAAIASTVADGAITSAKIAANSITAEKIATGVVGSTALAAGSVSSWQVLGSNPVTATPNTKYLMPQDGSGILTLPANPPTGTTIEVSGQGTVLANSNQLISGVWAEAGMGFRNSDWEGPSQVFVSDDGRTVVGYVDAKTSNPGPPVQENPARVRILRANTPGYVEFPVPSSSTGGSGSVPSGSQIVMSGDTSKFFGYFTTDAGIRLHKSENGGQSWQQIDLPVAALFGESASMPPGLFQIAGSQDLSTVYVLTDYPGGASSRTFIKTSDGGSNWAKVSDVPSGYTILTDSMFRVSDNGLILMANADGPSGRRLLRTEDGGITWTVLNPIVDASSMLYPPTPAIFLMSGDGKRISVVLSVMQLTVSTSLDGGASFSQKTQPNAYLNMSALSLSRSGNLLWSVAGGMYGMPLNVWRSGDLGQNLKVTSYTGLSSNPQRPQQIASNSYGTQVVTTRDVYDPSPNNKGGFLVSASDRVVLNESTANAEFIYRGDGIWCAVAPEGATGSFAASP